MLPFGDYNKIIVLAAIAGVCFEFNLIGLGAVLAICAFLGFVVVSISKG